MVLADAWPGPLLPWGASALPEGEGALSLSFRFSHCFLGLSGDAWPACVSGETGSPLSGAMCLCSSSGLITSFVTHFEWDMAKYPAKQPLVSIADTLAKVREGPSLGGRHTAVTGVTDHLG